jgi:hypothetical protein
MISFCQASQALRLNESISDSFSFLSLISKLPKQGCQVFLVHDTKTGKNVPNEHKMYQMVIKYTNVPNIFPMTIKYINIFQSKALQN